MSKRDVRQLIDKLHPLDEDSFACSVDRLKGIWRGMKFRCNNKSSSVYKYYGGRGISVCEEWENDFIAFAEWSLTHGYADHLSIDRMNADGNYSPDNCRWATDQEQAQNKRGRAVPDYPAHKDEPVKLSYQPKASLDVLMEEAEKLDLPDLTKILWMAKGMEAANRIREEERGA